MPIRMIAIALFAALAYAQPPAPPPGHHGFGGMGFGEARFLFAEPGRPGPLVKNAPYSAEWVTETVQTLADGNRIHQVNAGEIYRDSEGRTRREQTFPAPAMWGMIAATGGSPVRLVFISDPVAGLTYSLDPNRHTAMRSAVHPRDSSRGGRHMASGGPSPRYEGRDLNPHNWPNAKTESLARQMIEGVPADGTRTTVTTPAGQVGNDKPIVTVTETWYSPDLQTIVLSKQSDPRHGETTYKLTNISRAEPPHSLFEVPADYKVSDRPSRPPAKQ